MVLRKQQHPEDAEMDDQSEETPAMRGIRRHIDEDMEEEEANA